MPTTNFRRGDIVLVLFPESNLRTQSATQRLLFERMGLATGSLADLREVDTGLAATLGLG